MIVPYEPRFYRNFSKTRTVPFQVVHKESDLFIRAESDLSDIAKVQLKKLRGQLENYIEANPLFERSLVPMRLDPMAPKIVRQMLEHSAIAGVGPMAAVAGAVAQAVGESLLKESAQVIVENGGDLYLALKESMTVGVYAGRSPLSGKIGLRLAAAQTPCGLCASSGTFGHSYSEGKADVAIILAESACLADATATASGNKIRNAKDIKDTLEWALSLPGVTGACFIYKDKLGVLGDLELIPMEQS